MKPSANFGHGPLAGLGTSMVIVLVHSHLACNLYDPKLENVACGVDDICPPGLSCDLTDGICRRPGSPQGPDGGGAPGSDGGNILPYPPSNFDQWDTLQPVGAITLDCGASSYDSTNHTFVNWCGQPEPVLEIRNGNAVLAMGDLTITAASTLRLTGDRPVILAVIGDADIAGLVNASATLSVPGPGGSQDCATGAGKAGSAEVDPNKGAGGGGGGGFGTSGADGGLGGNSGSTSGAGGLAPGGVASLIPLRGGCSGGNGGPHIDEGTAGGGGGGGGGAIQISAQGTLRVSGVIAAAGGGGRGGSSRDGAGGGGAGGGILLEAVSLIVDGSALTANGGGGGEGGSSGGTTPEDDGLDGSTQTSIPVPGGSGASSLGGDGGDGGAGSTEPTKGNNGNVLSDSGGGGGGGGGATGVIRLNARDSCTENSAIISPPAMGTC